MFKIFRRNAAASRLIEEQLYEQVIKELELGHRRDGLWARALSNSYGKEDEATALYIRYRVQSIKDEAELNQAFSEEVTKRYESDLVRNESREQKAFSSENISSNSNQQKSISPRIVKDNFYDAIFQFDVDKIKKLLDSYPTRSDQLLNEMMEVIADLNEMNQISSVVERQKNEQIIDIIRTKFQIP